MFGLNKSYILFHYTLLNLFSQPKFDNHSFDCIYKHPLYVKPEKMCYLTESAEAPWLLLFFLTLNFYSMIYCALIAYVVLCVLFSAAALMKCENYFLNSKKKENLSYRQATTERTSTFYVMRSTKWRWGN